MKLEKYIRLLLPEHDTVIIPGFGAFVTHYKPAEHDEDSAEINPPSKTVEFNSKIKNNDGLLVGTIAEKEGISHFEALQKIEKERDNMFYKLDKGETITLAKIGTFSYDNNHEIQFEATESGNLLLDAYGLEPATLKASEIIPGGTEETGKEQENPEPFLSGVTPDETEHQNESTERTSSEKEPVTSDFTNNDSGGKKNKGWVWFLLILIPLVVAGIFLLRKEKEKEAPKFQINREPVSNDSLVAEKKPIFETDTAVIDTLQEAPADTLAGETERPKDSINYITPDPSKYYLVSGSFTQRENAHEFLLKLQNQGYDAFHLGKQGKFYIIGIGIYEKEHAAFAAQYDFLEKYPESGVWVYNVTQMDSGNY